MYDAGKIIPGLIVFFGLVSFPIWHNLALGTAAYRPNPQLPPVEPGQERCVESKAYMRSSHMDLLNTWRNQVVRQNQRLYVSAADGKEHRMSLSQTCMECHTSRAQFCDQCHSFMGVSPYCWDCHVEP